MILLVKSQLADFNTADAEASQHMLTVKPNDSTSSIFKIVFFKKPEIPEVNLYHKRKLK